MNIIGISAFYHDSASALVRDGEIIAAAQQERFSRIKHDDSFPEDALNYCLREGRLDINDVDLLAFYENPAIKFNRIMDMLANGNKGKKDRALAEKVIDLWSGYKFYQEDIIRENSGYEGKIIFPLHHQSHAASAFFPSPYNDAAVITLDGVGEYMSTTIGMGRGNRIKLLNSINFPHSLGMFYSAFTYFCGFKVNSGEYKLMGLAPYGEPQYTKLIEDNLIDIRKDGSYALNLEYFDYMNGKSMISENFRELFGCRERLPEENITQMDMDIASSVQATLEKAVLNIARHAREISDMESLCLAGGVALNCVANAKIVREKIFDNVWVQPAAGDAGGALGAALFAWHDYLDNPRTACESDSMKGAYLGPSFSEDEIKKYLDSIGAVYHRLPEKELLKTVAKYIANEKVVGHFNGRMEYGPRALGNRSLLGDARSPRLQKTMNLKIKYRESFRPFAPSVAEERARDFFDFHTPSPYMLMTAPVRREICLKADDSLSGLERLKEPLSAIPAVTHVDFSARLQTVSEKTNPRYFSLINEVAELTGVPVVINTSFNVRGEPMACAPKDAFECFMNTEMDALVLNGILLYKYEQPENLKKERKFNLD